MAFTVRIPITDHDSSCTQHYRAEYKRQDASTYEELYPYPNTGEIVIPDLMTGVWNVRISRLCCGGELSPFSTINVNVP